MNDELKETDAPETQPSFESAVEESLEQRQEQLEPPTPKNVIDKVLEFNRKSRQITREIANNPAVEWIPVVSPLLRCVLDKQKEMYALLGTDPDTGEKISGKERAKIIVASAARGFWEGEMAKMDVFFLLSGSSFAEKAGLNLGKTAGAKVAEKMGEKVGSKVIPAAVKKAVNLGIEQGAKGAMGGLDRLVTSKVGRS